MRIALAFLVIGAAWLTVSGAADSSADAAVRSELLRLERIWNDAHVRGDADVLDRLWDGELTVTVPGMPVMRKTQVLAIARGGRVKFERYETSDLNVSVLGEAAFVTGRVFRIRHVNGRVAQDDWRFTKVYFHRSDGWKVVAWHSSPAGIE